MNFFLRNAIGMLVGFQWLNPIWISSFNFIREYIIDSPFIAGMFALCWMYTLVALVDNLIRRRFPNFWNSSIMNWSKYEQRERR